MPASGDTVEDDSTTESVVAAAADDAGVELDASDYVVFDDNIAKC